ncbi:LLM class flavin-dependent oxidoreductase [Actinophytocola gossypii]|uniref:LLM class flavin-dependent oxidoreductase n=1 Tax=Actinophytocola gossypii TaxID=2812003 RepID=A0ABT2JFP4_9PSEU|nr:LLM class flavin-dependent oxidoreductase [Actinophytocola gossypii]MCT2586700.1 LLM class flavin-dependent oxidoreductase [Actinophytocola gossypii]
MRVGIVILPEYRWLLAEPKWRAAETYGFDHAWTYDHIGWRSLVDGPWFDAVPTLTAAAMVTRRIRLGTLVASPNFRHPVPFARSLLALDDVSNGRMILGVGAGTPAGYDNHVLGGEPLAPGPRVERFGEFVTQLDALLTNERTTIHGEHYRAVDARSAPGCVQHPRLPFVIAANGPRTMRLAARFGEGWVTTGKPADDLDAWWSGVAELARTFDDITGERPVDRYLSLDSAPVFSLSSVDCFGDAMGRARELGFTDVVCHWPRPDGVYAGRLNVLERVAAEILPYR